MTTATNAWTKEIVEVAGSRLEIVKGGSGPPLLVLHDEMAHHGALRWHDTLAEGNTLHIPSHPGFGESPRMDWVMNMRDLANWYLRALDELGLQNVNVIGLSMGGWLAAEMATMCPQQFNRMVLVGAAGIKPDVGEMFDIFLVTAEEYLETVCLDNDSVPEFSTVRPAEPPTEMLERWLDARIEACRLSWKPYMHYPGLPDLLGLVKDLPTLLIWGAQDSIVPVNAGEKYHLAISGSRLELIDNCGHRPEIEQTDEFLALVQGFLAGD